MTAANGDEAKLAPLRARKAEGVKAKADIIKKVTNVKKKFEKANEEKRKAAEESRLAKVQEAKDRDFTDAQGDDTRMTAWIGELTTIKNKIASAVAGGDQSQAEKLTALNNLITSASSRLGESKAFFGKLQGEKAKQDSEKAEKAAKAKLVEAKAQQYQFDTRFADLTFQITDLQTKSAATKSTR